MPSFVNFSPYFLNSKYYDENYHTVRLRGRAVFAQYVRGQQEALGF
jgi:hypothetical protein